MGATGATGAGSTGATGVGALSNIFSASNSVPQPITIFNTEQQVLFDTPVVANPAVYNPLTSTYTVPVGGAGIYEFFTAISGQVLGESLPGSFIVEIQFSINRLVQSEFAQLQGTFNTTTNENPNPWLAVDTSIKIALIDGDTVQVVATVVLVLASTLTAFTIGIGNALFHGARIA